MKRRNFLNSLGFFFIWFLVGMKINRWKWLISKVLLKETLFKWSKCYSSLQWRSLDIGATAAGMILTHFSGGVSLPWPRFSWNCTRFSRKDIKLFLPLAVTMNRCLLSEEIRRALPPSLNWWVVKHSLSYKKLQKKMFIFFWGCAVMIHKNKWKWISGVALLSLFHWLFFPSQMSHLVDTFQFLFPGNSKPRLEISLWNPRYD